MEKPTAAEVIISLHTVQDGENFSVRQRIDAAELGVKKAENSTCEFPLWQQSILLFTEEISIALGGFGS